MRRSDTPVRGTDPFVAGVYHFLQVGIGQFILGYIRANRSNGRIEFLDHF
jgi:hypothetical protein